MLSGGCQYSSSEAQLNALQWTSMASLLSSKGLQASGKSWWRLEGWLQSSSALSLLTSINIQYLFINSLVSPRMFSYLIYRDINCLALILNVVDRWEVTGYHSSTFGIQNQKTGTSRWKWPRHSSQLGRFSAIKLIELNAKVMNILCCELNTNEFNRVLSYSFAKKI